MPGATVRLTGKDTDATAVTDANGRFVIEAFLATSDIYTLMTALPGFDTASHQVQIVAGSSTPIDVVLRVGCVEVDLVVQRGIVAEALEADLVAHIRIDSVGPAREWRLERGCVIASGAEASLLADSLGGSRASCASWSRPERHPATSSEKNRSPHSSGTPRPSATPIGRLALRWSREWRPSTSNR